MVNWTLRNKLRWNLYRNSYIFIKENAFENIVNKTAVILSRPQCGNVNKYVDVSGVIEPLVGAFLQHSSNLPQNLKFKEIQRLSFTGPMSWEIHPKDAKRASETDMDSIRFHHNGIWMPADPPDLQTVYRPYKWTRVQLSALYCPVSI